MRKLFVALASVPIGRTSFAQPCDIEIGARYDDALCRVHGVTGHRVVPALVGTALLVVGLVGCGSGSPPSKDVNDAVTRAVLDAPQVVDPLLARMGNAFADSDALLIGSLHLQAALDPLRQTTDAVSNWAEVVDISVKGWEKTEQSKMMGDKAPLSFTTPWTARLRLKEPVGVILEECPGTRIVRLVAKEGDTIAFEGLALAIKGAEMWKVAATPRTKEPFSAWAKAAGPLTAEYSVVASDGTRSTQWRGAKWFVPVSELKPFVLEDSAEAKKLVADLAERKQKQQEETAAQAKQQQEAYAAQQKQQQEAYAAQLQQRQEENAARVKQQQEAHAEQQRQQAEAAQAKADEQRRQRALPFLQPFKNATGTAIVTDSGPAMGVVLLTADADETSYKVKGTGMDLRALPFTEFSYEGGVDDNYRLVLKVSSIDQPWTFGRASDDKLDGTTAGVTLAPLSAADRTSIDALVTLGARLVSAPPVNIQVETLDAAAAKSREPSLHLAPLVGTVLYRGKVSPTVAHMFAGTLTGKVVYGWNPNEVVSVRLTGPVRGSAIYIRTGSQGAVDTLIVTINSVHRVTITSIPTLGGAILTLPPDLDLLDLAFQAVRSTQIQAIALVQ